MVLAAWERSPCLTLRQCGWSQSSGWSQSLRAQLFPGTAPKWKWSSLSLYAVRKKKKMLHTPAWADFSDLYDIADSTPHLAGSAENTGRRHCNELHSQFIWEPAGALHSGLHERLGGWHYNLDLSKGLPTVTVTSCECALKMTEGPWATIRKYCFKYDGSLPCKRITYYLYSISPQKDLGYRRSDVIQLYGRQISWLGYRQLQTNKCSMLLLPNPAILSPNPSSFTSWQVERVYVEELS